MLSGWYGEHRDRLLSIIEHTSNTTCTTFSPDDALMAPASTGGDIRLWEIATGRQFDHVIRHGDAVKMRGLASSPDSTKLASSSPPHQGQVNGLAFAKDGSWLASSGERSDTRFWRTGDLATPFTTVPNTSKLVAFDRGGQRWAVRVGSGHGKGVRVLSTVPAATEIANIETVERVDDMAFSYDGQLLATGSTSGIVRVWDTETGAEYGGALTHGEAQLGVAFSVGVTFSPDGRLATAGADGTLKIWDVETSQLTLPRCARPAR
jgi:WD40 repeat protein